MDKTTKVELTEKWWTTNQPRTLKDKGNLGKSLKAFEQVWKLCFVSKGPTLIKYVELAQKALDAVEKSAKATSTACVKGVHDGAKHVLTKTLPAKANEFRKALEKRKAEVEGAYDKLTVDDVVKDRTLFGHLHKFAKTKYWDECTEFLVAVTKPGDKVYEKYIPENAPRQVNISYGTRIALSKAYEAGAVKKGPWKTAQKEILQVVRRNTELKEFRQYLKDQKVAV